MAWQGVDRVSGPPLVSVIVPAYNASRCLEESVTSAITQTLSNLEILIVDDGSTDNTLEVACRIARDDTRVRILSNARNAGAGAARNCARQHARGTWLAALDADDAWLPNRLEALLSTPRAETADVIADDVYRVDYASGEVWSCLVHRWQAPLHLQAPIWLTAAQLIRHHLGVLQPLVRRSFVEAHGIGEDPTLPFAEDFYFNLELLLAGARWLQVPDGYYLYVARETSLSTRHAEHGEEVLERHICRLRDPRIARDPELRAAVNAFIAEERVSLQVESVRVALSRPSSTLRDPRLVWRVLSSPELFVPMLTHTFRRLKARARRQRAASHTLGASVHPATTPHTSPNACIMPHRVA
jgi:GT2 family glycosyltransferase